MLAPIDRALALFALLFRTAETVLGAANTALEFMTVRVYVGDAGAFSAGEQESLIGILSNGGGLLSATVIFFAAGGAIFFWLLFRSRFIPRLLSIIGVASFAFLTAYGFANLTGFDLPPAAEYVWPLGAVAEIGGGLWLLVVGANLKFWKSRRVDGRAP